MHRDIKLENIFLKNNDQVLIGDFGFAKRDDETNTLLGNLITLAPEIYIIQ